MTLGDIIKGALKTDLYELLIWTSWYFRESRVSCKECIEVRAMGRGKAPDCCKCGLPTAKLLKEKLKGDYNNVQNQQKG